MKTDRDKWDARYSRTEPAPPTPDSLLVDHADLLTKGRALDLACGMGAESLFAAECGYVVDAVDISTFALTVLNGRARDRGVAVRCIAADLDSFVIPKETYDLVMVFYFFAPGLMAAIEGALKRGGLLFYSTFNHRHTSINPEFNPKYLVPPGGLAKFFPALDILLDEPYGGSDGNVARLIARRR
ncbi:MAG: class I SAM-dependent methyltransferase [Desulfomonile sp.]|nr:class I SAM-dependent methyltransferase [Desulfomonile sp.]